MEDLEGASPNHHPAAVAMTTVEGNLAAVEAGAVVEVEIDHDLEIYCVGLDAAS